MLEKNFYFENILGKEQSSFINIFNRTWEKHISSFPQKYVDGEQFNIGARFRPLILCWGYVLTENNFDALRKKELAELALYIELLHKATLLIDDSSRHGKKAFHVQYSPNEAILFAIYLVGDSLEQLSRSLRNSRVESTYFDISLLFCETIKSMTMGALQEVNLETSEFTSIRQIQEIIENQTISIIKNGLVTGFKFGNGRTELIEFVDSIGFDCGYIFQLLNDLEPFGSFSLNSKHKGCSNIDVFRSRKNLIIAFIYNELKKKERVIFRQVLQNNTLKEEELSLRVFQYYQKHRIIDSIKNNLKNVRSNIDSNIQKIEKQMSNQKIVADFKLFLNLMMKEAIKRVGPTHYNILSDILIK